MSTYHRLAASVALGAGIAAALIHAPSAHADPAGFLAGGQARGFYHSDGPSGLLRMGYAVCDYLSYPGATGTDAARIIYINTGWDVDRTEAAQFVIVSVGQLCPEYLPGSVA